MGFESMVVPQINKPQQGWMGQFVHFPHFVSRLTFNMQWHASPESAACALADKAVTNVYPHWACTDQHAKYGINPI